VPARHRDKQESVLVRRKAIEMSFLGEAPPADVCRRIDGDNNHLNSVDEPATHGARILSLDARIRHSHKEVVPGPSATTSSASDPFPKQENTVPVLLPRVSVEYRNIASVTKLRFFDD
jgi:hypothetical protein